jgi:hypothetical protein
MPDPIYLSALPDDVLSTVSTFLPLSGLITLVQGCRSFKTVLRDQLTRRLDEVFIITQSEIHFEIRFGYELLIQPLGLPCELEALFGVASIHGTFLSEPSYYFVEAPEECDTGPRGNFALFRSATFRPYQIGSSSSSCEYPSCFASWLRAASTRTTTSYRA